MCYVGGTDVHRMEEARTNHGMRFTCICLDGTEGSHYEHRIALFLADASAMVRVDEAAVGSLGAMAKGPPFLQSVHMSAQAEGAFAEARLDLDRAKRVIARILRGNPKRVSEAAAHSWKHHYGGVLCGPDVTRSQNH